MADEKQLQILRKGVEVWNKWREENIDITINLTNANLANVNLANANLNFANLWEANLQSANLSNALLNHSHLLNANLCSADFTNAKLFQSDLISANLENANLSFSSLMAANLLKANLTNANLTGANIQYANLVQANIEQATLTNCKVYGLSGWGLKGNPQNQSNLIITLDGESTITVDDITLAQFIYLLLNRENVRNVLNTITTKAVLILGRFTPERKIILDAIAVELRKNNLLPIIFDFDKPTNRDFTETIKTLAGMSFFVIADITNPKSSPLEMQATVPDYKIPFVPIIQEGEEPFSMFSDLMGKYDWVLPLLKYKSKEELLSILKPAIIDRAWQKHKELQNRKTQAIEALTFEDFQNETPYIP